MTSVPAPFDPDWCIPPGETLKETLEEIKVGVEAFAEWSGLPLVWVKDFIRGDEELTAERAQMLEDTTCIPVRLWMRMEEIYRDGVARGKIVVRMV